MQTVGMAQSRPVLEQEADFSKIGAQQKFDLLEERIQALENGNESYDPREFCLVPNLVIPPKFKVPNFEKYDGTRCPKTHLATYCHKMVQHASDENLLIHVFQETLMGTASEWYHKLEKGQVRTWRELSRAFLKRYEYMLEMVPDRLTLENMRKGPNEGCKEYAARWMGVASQVQPLLTKRETNSLFVDTLPPVYYEKLIGNICSEFSDLMYVMGKIEDGIRKGKLMNTDERSSMEKKDDMFAKYIGATMVEEQNKAKFNMTEKRPFGTHPSPHVSNLSYPFCSHIPAPHASHLPQPYHAFVLPENQEINSGRPQGHKRKRAKIYHPIPMSYTELFHQLVQSNKICTAPTKPKKHPYPKGYDLNARCEYHNGVEGHSTENCTALKRKVQTLIDEDPMGFKEIVSNFEGDEE